MAKKKKKTEEPGFGDLMNQITADHGGFDVDGLRKTIVGLPIPHYSERFIRDSDKYIVGKVEQYIGDPGSGKSAYGLHVGAQFVKAGGYFILVETENKISPATVEARLGPELMATGRIKFVPASSLDRVSEDNEDGESSFAWQQIVKSYVDAARSTAAGRRIPVYILVDSILGATTKEMDDDFEENKGLVSGRTTAHMARANSIGMWINAISSRLAGTNILLGFTNHKMTTIPMGRAAMYETPKDTYGGGEKLKFQTALALLFSRGADKTSTNEASRSTKLSVMKNSFGGEERKMEIVGTYRTFTDRDGNPILDEDGYPQRMLWWDWVSASAEILADHGISGRKRYAQQAKDLLGLTTACTNTKITCKPLGLQDTSYHEYGEAVDNDLDYQRHFMAFSKLAYNHYRLADVDRADTGGQTRQESGKAQEPEPEGNA